MQLSQICSCQLKGFVGQLVWVTLMSAENKNWGIRSRTIFWVKTPKDSCKMEEFNLKGRLVIPAKSAFPSQTLRWFLSSCSELACPDGFILLYVWTLSERCRHVKKLLQMCVFHMLVFSGCTVNTDSGPSPICLKTSVIILLNARTYKI